MKKYLNWFNFAILLAIIGFAFLLFNIFWIAFVNKNITSSINPIDFNLASNIGSYIGGIIGVFWSGAGVILIYATFKKQQEFNTNQAFEQSFQNLMNSYHIIVNNTRDKIDTFNNTSYKEKIGRAFFSAFLKRIKYGFEYPAFIEELIEDESIPETIAFREKNKISNENILTQHKTEFKTELLKVKKNENKFSIELTLKRYEFFYALHQNCLGHYFRFIYNIFKFILESKDSEEERIKYINLIQAHMSNDELGILFYNALSKYAKNKQGISQFKNWLEKYNFFENIDENSLLSKTDSGFYKIVYKFSKI
jgi:hypothetical protein